MSLPIPDLLVSRALRRPDCHLRFDGNLGNDEITGVGSPRSGIDTALAAAAGRGAGRR